VVVDRMQNSIHADRDRFTATPPEIVSSKLVNYPALAGSIKMRTAYENCSG
jgi:hypothetical protein